MARCEGIKKDGTRCRRPATTGSEFCSSHVPAGDDSEPIEVVSAAREADDTQEQETTERKRADSGGRRPRRKKHPLSDVAVIGVVAIVLLALRRVIRF